MQKTNSAQTTQLLDFLNSISKSNRPNLKEENKHTLDDFQNKEAKLVRAEAQLKKEFVGIDDQIERVINLVRPWYLMPKAIRKPIVIGLWGMTGVGKTSLVNRLVHFLEFEEFFFSEDLGRYTGDDSAIQQRIHFSSLPRLSGQPSILLLDEIHNVRTIDHYGVELDRSAMRDFWQLLDNGLVARDMERYQEMIMMMQTELAYTAAGMDEPEKYLNERWESVLSTYMLDKVIIQLELPVVTAHLQKMIALDMRGFMHWLITEYQWFCKYSKTMDFRKSIIFVAGNLDEVFADSNKVNPEDLTANELHEKTIQIGVDTVKECLLRRFKPEQVARLGGSLLVFPSLSRESVLKLVDNQLRELTAFYKNEFDWTMNFHTSVKDLVFREGTIAAQGARIVLSTLSDLVESRLPTWLVHCLKAEVKNVTVSFSMTKKTFEITHGKKNELLFSEAVTLREDRLPEINLSDAHRNVLAVHEAGHVVVGVASLGILPIKVLAGPSSWHRGGPRAVFPPMELKTKELMYQLIHVSFGGRAAEELVFGENSVSAGCSQDIYKATYLATQMLTQLGMGNHMGMSQPDPSSPFSLTSFKNDDDKNSERILADAYKHTKAILQEQWTLLMAISEKLQTNDKLTIHDFADLVKKHYKGSKAEIEKIVSRKEPRALDSIIISPAAKRTA